MIEVRAVIAFLKGLEAGSKYKKGKFWGEGNVCSLILIPIIEYA